MLEQVPAWRGHIRSRSALRVTPKRTFVDPSIAVATLGVTPADVRADLEYLGLLFESLAIRGLRVLAEPLGGEGTHMRDAEGHEVDAVVTFGYRTWVAMEIKMASTGPRIEQAAALRKFSSRVDRDREGEPAALVNPIWALEP